MIQLTIPNKPAELTKEWQDAQTQIYKNDNNKSVWSVQFIKTALLEMTHGKCCYCECPVTEESNYMEVEHFHPKSIYEDEVLEWSNLFAACKRCNSGKDNLDTVTEPFINPEIDRPQDHMYLYAGIIFRPKNDKGDMTITRLSLNDLERREKSRYVLVCELSKKILDIKEKLTEYQSLENKAALKASKLIKAVRDLLNECQPESTYSAIKSTCVLSDPEYDVVKQIMNEENLWTEEMDNLERNMIQNKYDTQP